MSPRLRIAIVLHRYFPHGGLQRDALMSALECASRGHEVTLHVQRWDGKRPRGVAVRLHRVRGFSNHARARSFASALQGALSPSSVDLKLGFDRLPGLDLHFAGDPCYVERVHSTRSALSRWTPRYRALRALEASVFGAEETTRILLLDPREKVLFQRHHGTQEERFVELLPGVGSDRRPSHDSEAVGRSLRRALDVGEDERLILFLGSDFRRKGLDRVLRALAALPDDLRERTQLLAAGDDDPAAALQLARALGVAGRVRIEAGRDDVPALLAAANLLVHPARSEPAGMVVLESIAAGLPVLCTETVGNARVVAAAGAGIVVPEPFQQPALNEALARALQDDAERSWRASARAFGLTRDLFSMHAAIADEVERHAASAPGDDEQVAEHVDRPRSEG